MVSLGITPRRFIDMNLSRREKPRPQPRVVPVLYNLTAVKIPEGVTMPSLGNALQELRKDRSATQLRLDRLDQIISGIESLNGTGASGTTTQPKRIVTAASRRKMARAQKARWASIRKGSQPVASSTGSAAPKRTMSASARKKIAAAQKARWAKVRAQQKKAA